MRFGSIKLINYIKIYNGLGINELFIDFKKCKHNTVIIKGLNGSGKSSLMSALHPMPDSNDSFIPEKEAIKEIEILDGPNIYFLTFIHPIKSNKERDTTKAYIKKTFNSVTTELNPNGNVSSFKDVLYSEFNLDSNFVSLSQLSSEDRGLVDKTPAERKKFANNIINNLEVYNEMHKTLNKRASSFKSITNRLLSRIDSIGDKSKIESELKAIDNRLNTLLSQKDNILQEISSYKTHISLIDPDGSIQELYNKIYSNIKLINESLLDNNNKLNKLYASLGLNSTDELNIDYFSDKFKNINNIINELRTSIQIDENHIQVLLSNRESEVKEIVKKNNRLDALKSDKNFIDIQNDMQMYLLKIEEYENIFKTIGISNKINLSKDEYVLGLNTLKTIKDIIDVLKSGVNYNVLTITIDDYINKNIIPNIEDINNKIQVKQDQLKDLEIQLYSNITLLETSKKLDLRPSNCKINDCNFIKDAISANNKNPKENIDIIEKSIYQNNNELSELLKLKKQMTEINECYFNISRILRDIDSHLNILKKLPNTEGIINRNRLLDNIKSGYKFEEIDTLYQYIEYCDVFENYKLYKENLNKLKTEYEIFKSKNDLIDDIVQDINNINNKLSNITTEIEEKRNSILNNNIELKKNNELLLIYEMVLDLINSKSKLEQSKLEYVSQFHSIKDNIEKIKIYTDHLFKLESDLTGLNNILPEMISNRDELKYNLKVLEEYELDLELYTSKYNKVQEIKYYCSPTTGIQLLYIELYMNKTISMANELLSLVFDGEFIINPFIINDREFRIPCVGEGFPRDDISSLSTSQKSIISMILSFVLLKQSSTKYNILRLDEIDGGLDEFNRAKFIRLLEQQMMLLDVEQCIMISHNAELDLSNSDLILLKTKPSQKYDGNIIYQYM